MSDYAVRLDDYLRLPMPHLEWAVSHMMPKPGIVVLAGRPFEGKSFLALQMARSIAQGHSFLGRGTKKMKVVYFCLESPLVMRSRLSDLETLGWNLDLDIFTPHPDSKPTRVDILKSECRDWMRQVNREVNPGVVILDPFRDLHNADENESRDMKIVSDWILDVFHNQAVLLVHHVTKIPDEFNPEYADVVKIVRGSSQITGVADAVWLLHEKYLVTVSRFALKAIWMGSRKDGLWDLHEVDS